MLDIGWQELLVIGALALIVVGPKDLPGLLRSVGQWVGKMRGMAREFQSSMNEAARQTDLAKIRELNELKSDLSKTIDFKEQASKAQSFLDSPPEVEKTDPKPDAVTDTSPPKPDEAPAATTAPAPADQTAPTPATPEPDTKATGT
ncbi:MAG: Sec-independent protein translocase protein TatB [Pseudomonadota bacterium]